MRQLLADVLTALTSEDQREQDDAILHAAMLLERRRFRNTKDEDYVGLLTPELIGVKLTRTEQQAFVAALLNLLNEQLSHGPVWAIGKAPRVFGFPAIVAVIDQSGSRMDSGTTRQAMIALENHLGNEYDLDAKSLREQRHLLTTFKVKEWIEQASQGDNEDFIDVGVRLLRDLEANHDSYTE